MSNNDDEKLVSLFQQRSAKKDEDKVEKQESVNKSNKDKKTELLKLFKEGSKPKEPSRNKAIPLVSQSIEDGDHNTQTVNGQAVHQSNKGGSHNIQTVAPVNLTFNQEKPNTITVTNSGQKVIISPTPEISPDNPNMVKCPSCSEHASRYAKACPHCGYDIRQHFDGLYLTEQKSMFGNIG